MKERNVSLEGKTVLITGAAGFIGSHLSTRLLEEFKDIKKLKLTDTDLEAANGSRNYYSHILKLEKKEDKHALEGWELFDLTKKLRVLLICCVLNFMGMDNDKINQLLNKSSNDFLRISDKNK